MKFEAVEFYPLSRDDSKGYLNGTMHLFWVDKKLDLRGIKIHKQKNRIFVWLPYVYAFDFETREVVKYPFMIPILEDEKKEMLEAIRQTASDFLEKNVLCKKCEPFDRREEHQMKIKSAAIKKSFEKKNKLKQNFIPSKSKSQRISL